MRNQLLTGMFSHIYSRLGLSFDPIETPALRAGTIRAREREAEKRLRLNILYANTPTHPPSRQVRRRAAA